jgi:lysophospholipase L1-like esterase
MIADLCFGTLAPGVAEAFHAHAQNLDSHVKQWTTAQHLPFLSLLPTIEKVFSEQEVADIMIEDDGHPTATGHLLIKETLQPWLRKQLKK